MLNDNNEEKEILEQINDTTKDNMDYYFTRDPQFITSLIWQILAFFINPLLGTAGLVFLFMGHHSFMNKDLKKSLDYYDFGKRFSLYGIYVTLGLLVLLLVIIIIRLSVA